MAKRVEVVFRQDIENVAKKGERKVVAGGYWRNFLLPQGLAVLAGTKQGRKLAGGRVVEVPPPPIPAKPSEPVKIAEKRVKRVVRKAAKKEKETKKSATLKAKISKPVKGKE